MATQAARDAGDTRYQQKHNCAEKRLANGLGWFSIGLGLAELAAPRQVARLVGARDEDNTRTVLRAYGIRELAAGSAYFHRIDPPAGCGAVSRETCSTSRRLAVR